MAQVFENIVATFPFVPLAALFYRALETDKTVGLKRYSENYKAKTKLSNEPWYELVFWKQITKNSFTDASELVWAQLTGISHLEISGQNMKEWILM